MLLQQYAHRCVKVVPVTTESSEGGCKTDWTEEDELADWLEDVEFVAYMALERSSDKSRGGKDTYLDTYNVLVDSSVDIHYKDYFRTDKDTYLVITEPSINVAPESASFSLKNFTAKREGLSWLN